MTSEDFDRGWYAGCQSLVDYLFGEFKAKRKGAIPSMDSIRFDALVEKHLEHAKPEDDRQPDKEPDNRDAPLAKPICDGKRVKCPGCRGIMSKHLPARCPDCLQRIEREVSK